MTSPNTRFVVSPQGGTRFWIAVMMLGFPAIFVLAWWLDPPKDPSHDVSPSVARFGLEVFIVLLIVTFVGGLYYSLLVRVITIDTACGQVCRTTTLLGRELRRCTWSVSDFVSIAVRHHSSGDSPGDNYQTDIGLDHSSGSVIWLRAFPASTEGPGEEALSFAAELAVYVGKLKLRRVA